jgi:hypothetical protein
MKYTLTLLLAILFSGIAASQTFEGIIEFKIEAPGVDESVKSMMPKKTTSFIKAEKIRTEMDNPMTGKSVTILDNEKNKVFQLINMGGTKKCISIDIDNKNENQDSEVHKLDDTKQIAGYPCKKVEIIQDENITIAWVTDEIQAPTNRQFNQKIDGFPLSYEVENNGITMIMTATSVEETQVNDNKFIVPQEYEKISMEEAQQLMRGQ